MTKKVVSFSAEKEQIFITGPAGQLEVSIVYSKNPEENKIGIICHPHSLHGGTMNNKVVTTVAKVFEDLGMTSIRFNFRGVGKSKGKYDHGIGETEDLLAVIDWIRQQKIKSIIYLAGFSFGSYVAYRAASQLDLAYLVLIAPPIPHYDFNVLSEPKNFWIIVQGDQDEVIAASEVYTWLEKLKTQPQVLRFPEASHFFHGKLVELRERLRVALYTSHS